MWIFALKFMHFFWVSGLILNYFEDLFQASLWLGFYVMCNGCSFIKFHNPLVHLLCTCCCTVIFFTPFFFKFNMSDFSQTFSVFNLYCIEWKTARRKRVLVIRDDPNYLIKRGGKWDTNYTKNPSKDSEQ